MNLPVNGRIVIVDDKIEEAEPIMRMLSKKRVPYNYYTGSRRAELPVVNASNDLRVLFLDLNIIQGAPNEKSVISSLHRILERVCPTNPTPYILIVWSKLSDAYKTALEEHFKSKLADRLPAKILYFQKSDYLMLMGEKWRVRAGAMKKIENDINRELEQLSVMRKFIHWENMVHEATGNTLNQFLNFYPFDGQWEENNKSVIYQLSKAVVGRDRMNNLTNDEIVKTAFNVVNNVLVDELETNIQNDGLGNAPEKNVKEITPEIKIQINSKIHCTTYKLKRGVGEHGNIIRIRGNAKMIQNIKDDIITTQDPWLVMLDITPACDYSQDKNYVRTVYGIAIEKSSQIRKKPIYYYFTPTLFFADEERILVFDFRFIKTFTKSEFEKMKFKPMVRLRKELCTDIQSQLSNHINRPGVSTIG